MCYNSEKSSDMEERRENIGDQCDLYEKCFSMHSAWGLFASEVTQTKKQLNELKVLEEQAKSDRKQTSDRVEEIQSSFVRHIDEEMEVQKEHVSMTKEHTKVLNELKDVITDMRHDHQDTKDSLKKEVNDTAWLKKFGYGAASLFGAGLLYIFLNINQTDKTMVKIETNLERNTEVLNELKNYFRGEPR